MTLNPNLLAACPPQTMRELTAYHKRQTQALTKQARAVQKICQRLDNLLAKPVPLHELTPSRQLQVAEQMSLLRRELPTLQVQAEQYSEDFLP